MAGHFEHRWGNAVLDGLLPDDAAALWPALQLVELERGTVLVDQGLPVSKVHFPVTCDLTNVRLLADGGRVEASSVGPDGVSGLAAFLADEPIAWEVSVRVGGAAYVIDAAVLRRLHDCSAALRSTMLRVTHANQVEIARNLVCGVHHSTSKRLARWLLVLQDRTGKDEFDLTQQEIADVLGIQRTTMNEVAQQLRSLGAIRFLRGRISISDRDSLRASSCVCYAEQ